MRRFLRDLVSGPFWAVIALLVIVYGVFAYEAMIWNECRGAGHSWPYCVRMLGR